MRRELFDHIGSRACPRLASGVRISAGPIHTHLLTRGGCRDPIERHHEGLPDAALFREDLSSRRRSAGSSGAGAALPSRSSGRRSGPSLPVGTRSDKGGDMEGDRAVGPFVDQPADVVAVAVLFFEQRQNRTSVLPRFSSRSSAIWLICGHIIYQVSAPSNLRRRHLDLSNCGHRRPMVGYM